MGLTCSVALVTFALGPGSLDRVVVGMVINVTVVVGLYTFVGISGVFSFGHAAFMAIGAYSSAILVIPPETKRFVLPDLPTFLADLHLEPFPATVVAGALAAAFALVLSLPLARLSGLTAGLATFAVLSIVNIVARNWQQVTHGTSGVSGIPTTTTIWGALGWALAAMTAAWVFQRSRIGLRLRASRESEAAARSIGVAVARERTIAFVLSAFFVGVAGALLGMFIGSFNPDAFFLNITFLMMVMLVIGGTASLAGAVVGTIAISAASELLRRVEGGFDLVVVQWSGEPGLREVGLALAMLAILIFRPGGITGGREVAWPRILARRISQR
jgi:branched-chain amino acid transport system permease protein